MTKKRSGVLSVLAGVVLTTAGAAACAADGPQREIYSCDLAGKRITRDRYIVECSNITQRVLNTDGSFKRMAPPTPTEDENAELEAHRRDAELARICLQDAQRRDRNLVARFHDEAAHRKARESALNDINKAVATSDARIAALKKERKPMEEEAEFYNGKTMPTKLRTQLETNDALVEAQRALIQNQGIEIGRINKLYDAELLHLKKLWAGAQPGADSNCMNIANTAAPKS
jgi:hypothetical protein